jgi:hypothetical protein
MIDINLKFQVVLFGSFEDISPKPETLKYLIDAFAEKELIPTTIQELGPNGIFNRISLKSSDNVWNLQFMSNRIDIEKTNKNIGETKMESIDDFITEANDIIKRLDEKFHKKYNRLSLVTRNLLKEMNPDEIFSIFSKISKTIEFYDLNKPVDWRNRIVSRIPLKISEEETINVISDINRLKGSLKINSKIQEIDRVELKFDINTFQGNTEYRFSLEDIGIFLEEVTKIEKQLILDYIKLFS